MPPRKPNFEEYFSSPEVEEEDLLLDESSKHHQEIKELITTIFSIDIKDLEDLDYKESELGSDERHIKINKRMIRRLVHGNSKEKSAILAGYPASPLGDGFECDVQIQNFPDLVKYFYVEYLKKIDKEMFEDIAPTKKEVVKSGGSTKKVYEVKEFEDAEIKTKDKLTTFGKQSKSRKNVDYFEYRRVIIDMYGEAMSEGTFTERLKILKELRTVVDKENVVSGRVEEINKMFYNLKMKQGNSKGIVEVIGETEVNE